ncbi:adenylate/guanylate cyclase domain-containing protein [Spirochaetia bacterium]|nr:adenylate/guanylate cyclase domain-containing protein [Spirochaetia bacterium]
MAKNSTPRIRRGRKINKNLAALLMTVFVFLAVGLFNFLGFFEYLEFKTYDFRVRLLAGTTRPSDDIMVILLNQDSIDWAYRERGWPWPWPRKAYSELIDYMNLSGARALTFDVIFSEPSYSPDDDEAFIRSSEDFGRVIQTVFFSTQSGNMFTWPGTLDTPLFTPQNFGALLPQFGGQTGAQFPIPGLRDTAGVIGSVTVKPDSDGVIRRVKLFTLFDGKAVPGLSAASLLAAGADRNITYNEKDRTIGWENYSIPVTKDGSSLLRFRGSIDPYTYVPYSIADVLQSAERHARGEEPLYYPEDFAGKYVFFGYYAPGLFDICSTPIESVYPGMGVHITMLDNIIKQDFIRETPPAVVYLIILAAIILINVLLFYSTKIPVAVGGGVLVLMILNGAGIFAYTAGYWVPMVAPIAAAVLSFLATTLYNYATEGSQRRFIKSAFSQYLSPAVIEQIIADPSQLKLGGEKREMTAIFTDIRSFSTISEALGDPAKLVELLNFYLTRMSNIILENHGTIDKYEGDAIIAFFGAPVHIPNHAALACRSAILMKRAEVEINREALAQGLITGKVMDAMVHKGILKSADDPNPIYTRLGINTGDMVVGNMGTPNKMDYTIMGNAVNLAARLEGVNKQYNTGGILISEYTREKIVDEFITRPLSRARVVGVNTPLRLYELLDIRDQAAPELLDMITVWDRGFSAYENRNFSEALNLFKTIYQNNEQDRVAKLYLDRCERYIAAPPADAQWDNGVDNLTEK